MAVGRESRRRQTQTRRGEEYQPMYGSPSLRVFTALVTITLAGLATAAHPQTAARAASTHSQSLCIAHHPQDFVWYTSSCTGHDEPEIDRLSNRAGSAPDLTWTIVLPANGAQQVDSVGPTFWIGGTVTDPHSLFGEAFLELQFYPNSITTGCTAGGGYNVTYAPNTFTACSPV